MISIQTNVNSMAAQENLRVTTDFQARTIARLTSGYRINQSGDDAAGLSVANKFRSDVAELTQGVRNANDGLSTLQVIDGGLSNISKMLDRLKTLATQSASSTFEGNRALLNTEYQDLTSEITRQAGSIGLGTGATGGRYNRDLSVYVGGAQQGTPKVSVDLAGSSSKVDAAGLGLVGTSINGGALSGLTGGTANVLDISSSKTLLSTGPFTQAFTFNITKPGSASISTTVTVTGSAAGLDAGAVLSQLNAGLNQHGISANLNTSGQLAFSGDSAFTATTTGSAAANLTTTGTSTGTNNSMHQILGTGALAATDSVTLKVGASTVTAATTVVATIQTTLNNLNDAFNALGVYAVKNAAGTGVDFQSRNDFSVTSTTATGIFTTAQTDLADTDPSGTATATSAAEAAISAISAAVGSLGVVQGKIGSGQNKLQYSISLAQSQITNFSAAESRIRDADVAQEAANLTKASVLSQASMAALAQANSAPQAVLSLLRG